MSRGSAAVVTLSERGCATIGRVGEMARLRASWGLSGASCLALAAGVALALVRGDAVWWILIWGLPVLGFAVVGLVLAQRVRSNPIGGLFLSVGFALGCGVAADAYGSSSPRLAGSTVIALLASLLEPLPLVILPALLMLFPEGRLPSPRWRPAAASWAVAAVLVAVDIIVSRGPIGTFSDAPLPSNPIGVGGGVGETIHTAGGLSFFILVLLLLIAAGSLISRFRRASGALREQLKWFGFAAAFLALAILAGPLGAWNVWSGNLWLLLEALGLTTVVIATGIALTRYRLYEIDRLISRTLSYAIITSLLAGIFIALVLVTTRVLPFSSPVGVAASTLAAATLFNPLRRWTQRSVDRRFNRARYDADAIVEVFNRALRDAVDLDSVQTRLISAVEQAVAPDGAWLWIRPRA
jgi:hypothetical protein